jgi:hypothetical protein
MTFANNHGANRHLGRFIGLGSLAQRFAHEVVIAL